MMRMRRDTHLNCGFVWSNCICFHVDVCADMELGPGVVELKGDKRNRKRISPDFQDFM